MRERTRLLLLRPPTRLQKLGQAEGNGGNDWPGIMRAAPWLQEQRKGLSAADGDTQPAAGAEEGEVDLQQR